MTAVDAGLGVVEGVNDVLQDLSGGELFLFGLGPFGGFFEGGGVGGVIAK